MRHHAAAALTRGHLKLMKAIDNEQSLETFEDIMSEDPMLSYRFMIYTNSAPGPAHRHRLAAPGHGDDGVRVHQALAVGPAAPLQHRAQHAAHPRVHGDACAPDHTAAQPGVENELRREVYLCALLSQMDELLREPLGTILRRIPLSERIYDATCCTPAPTHPACKWPARWKPTTPA
jgi:EAL and modified HD-GYP domain-containing signal transduction protein